MRLAVLRPNVEPKVFFQPPNPESMFKMSVSLLLRFAAVSFTVN